MEKEKFLENLQKLTDLAKSKKNTLDMNDINDILSIDCIGQVPDDEMVVTSTNKGEPCITMEHSLAGQAYRNIVGRICGEDIPFMEFPKEGFFQRLKRRVFGA